jgi:transcriptional regulator with XRE-family HTH domain
MLKGYLKKDTLSSIFSFFGGLIPMDTKSSINSHLKGFSGQGIFVIVSIMQEGDIDNLIGKNLRRLRETRGLSQSGLGDAVGMDKTKISAYENAHAVMGKDVMTRFCNALSVQPWEFYVDEETPIVTSGLEQRAIYMVREAEKEHLDYVAEETVEYAIGRIKQSKKKLQKGTAGESGAARPSARRR